MWFGGGGGWQGGRRGGFWGGGGLGWWWRGDLYSVYDDTLEMKVPREGDCPASRGSSFQSLTVQGINVLCL